MAAELVREYFDNGLSDVMRGVSGRVTPAHVELPGGDEADVAIKILLDFPAQDALIVHGIARYADGHVVGEHHGQPASSSSRRNGHTHMPEACMDFVQRGELFVPIDAGVEARSHPLSRQDGDNGLALGCAILSDMLDSAAAYDVLEPYPTVQTIHRAASLRGEGDRHELFVDPALQLALDQQIANINL